MKIYCSNHKCGNEKRGEIKKVRKHVSFSDENLQTVVNSSEDLIKEENLPNRVLERVLGKSLLQCSHINNGWKERQQSFNNPIVTSPKSKEEEAN